MDAQGWELGWERGSGWAGLRGRVMERGRALSDEELARICRRPGRLMERVLEAYGTAEARFLGNGQGAAAVESPAPVASNARRSP